MAEAPLETAAKLCTMAYSGNGCPFPRCDRKHGIWELHAGCEVRFEPLAVFKYESYAGAAEDPIDRLLF